MAEEQRWEEQGRSHRLCANNCGFFGTTTNNNLCSKCHQQIKHIENNKPLLLRSFSPSPILASSSSKSSSPPTPPEEPAVYTTARPNRCGACRTRVGLTGITCRCGITFCGSHRYPEKHRCEFDYKAMGREEIARANPVVKADKLDRI